MSSSKYPRTSATEILLVFLPRPAQTKGWEWEGRKEKVKRKTGWYFSPVFPAPLEILLREGRRMKRWGNSINAVPQALDFSGSQKMRMPLFWNVFYFAVDRKFSHSTVCLVGGETPKSKLTSLHLLSPNNFSYLDWVNICNVNLHLHERISTWTR